MPQTVRIKRRTLASGTGAPGALAQGELAYNETDERLYIGIESAGIDIIGGAGKFLPVAATGIPAVTAFSSSAPMTVVSRTLTGTANEVVVADGDGVSGNPTFGIADDPVLPGNAKVSIPSGTTAQEPAGADGDIRYDSDTGQFRGKKGGTWTDFATGAGDPDQNLFATIAGDTGSAVADTTTDTITMTGGTGITTVAASTPDTVTFNLDLPSLADLGAAPDSTDTLLVGDAGVHKEMTVANLFTSPALLTTPTAPTAAAGDSSTQIATTAHVKSVVLNDFAAPDGDVALGSNKITGLAAGTAATDAVNFGQLASVSSGISWKESVRATTTANGVLATAFENGDSIDGVTLATGDRILLKDQSTGAENGIYTVEASGAPTRALDADANAEVTGGMSVWVNEGTANGDTGWVLTTDDPITVDTTALTFTQFSGTGQITAGTGLTKTGNTIDAIGTASRISVAADAIDIDAAYVGQASITTLGTITTGTWTGTDIAEVDGGTGRGTYTTGDILYSDASNSLSVLGIGSTDNLLTVTAGVPAWTGTVDGGTF